MQLPVAPGLAADPALAFAAGALEPAVIAPHLEGLLGPLELRRAALLRHKPGKRALVAYDLSHIRGHAGGTLQVLGKVRAKGTDRATHKLQTALWQAGFADDSADGVSVPEPLGTLEPFHMNVQRRVPGVGLETLLRSPQITALLPRVAAGLHKLHRSAAPTRRCHTLSDELAVLQRQLAALGHAQPHWAARLDAVFGACVRLAQTLPLPRVARLHRDFYPEQLFAHGERLYLLDLDLCAVGDPALDLGNFTAHVSEYALRTTGDSEALRALEADLTEHFCQLSGVSAEAVSVYHTLSLARHLAISWRLPERRRLTPLLFDLVDARLGSLSPVS